MPWSQIQARQRDAEELRRTAEREYWAKQVTAGATPRRWYCCLMTRLGQKMVTIGQRLQAHYGETQPINPLPKPGH